MKLKCILVIVLVCLLIGCSDSSKSINMKDSIAESEKIENPIDSILSVEDIKGSKVVTDYFSEKDVIVQNIELTKRQTNKEDKKDIVYVKIVSENDLIRVKGIYEIHCSFYDIGGWQAEYMYIEETETYEAISVPKLEMRHEEGKVEILEETNIDNNKFSITYCCLQSGEIADIKHIWTEEFVFDTKKGTWSSCNVYSVSFSVELKEEVNGRYKLKRYDDTEACSKYILDFDGENDKLCLKSKEYDQYDETFNFIDYGGSSIYYYESSEEYYCIYHSLYNNKYYDIQLIITPDKIYVANVMSNYSDNSSLIKYAQVDNDNSLSVVTDSGTGVKKTLITHEHLTQVGIGWTTKQGEVVDTYIRIEFNDIGTEILREAKVGDYELEVFWNGEKLDVYMDLENIIYGYAHIKGLNPEKEGEQFYKELKTLVRS